MHYEPYNDNFSRTVLPFPPLRPRSYTFMSRRTDYNTLPTGEQSLQDDEAISATGEGDEEMEDAEEQEEGYSAYIRPSECSAGFSYVIPTCAPIFTTVASVACQTCRVLKALRPQHPH